MIREREIIDMLYDGGSESVLSDFKRYKVHREREREREICRSV